MRPGSHGVAASQRTTWLMVDQGPGGRSATVRHGSNLRSHAYQMRLELRLGLGRRLALKAAGHAGQRLP
jgi:hypothetical protein